MERNFEFKDFEPNDRIRNVIDHLIARLEKHASRFSPKVIHLRMMLVENSVRKLYPISITLHLPGKTLAAKEEQHDAQTAIRATFAEIERQLEKYKAHVRGERWKRLGRRERVRAMTVEAEASAPEESKREVFMSLVTPHLNRLYQFVGHVIRYAEAMGDVVEGELAPEDVVDAALVRAYRGFLREETIPDVKRWLLRPALDQLDAEVLRLSVERAGTVNIEEDMPEVAPTAAVSTFGDEFLDFYQPDEDLKAAWMKSQQRIGGRR